MELSDAATSGPALRLVIESIVGALWIRLFLTGEPLTESAVNALVDQTVAGLAATA